MLQNIKHKIPGRVLSAGRRLLIRAGVFKKTYSGNVFERFTDLDFILAKCNGCSILDFGCCDGRISYEFAKRGATLIHGFDLDSKRIRFARRLLADIPQSSMFVNANLAMSGKKFLAKYSGRLSKNYDIVLFLGIFHHLKGSMSPEDLEDLVVTLLSICNKYFVIRSELSYECEPLVSANGFQLLHRGKSNEKVGLLSVYGREEANRRGARLALGNDAGR